MIAKVRKIILKKHRGDITSLIIGQLFMFLLIVWGLFSYRLTMLNALFDYVDDSLTSSVLGAALVNVEEYGKSNQLIIHDKEEYTNDAWTEEESAILLSELNYGSDITLTASDLDSKQLIDYNARNHLVTDEDYKDEYLRKAVSAFLYCINYNLSNGNVHTEYKAENMLDNVSSSGGYQHVKTISHDILTRSFLGQFITTDITVSRFDIYSVYRDRLAERHVYASKYMLYKFNGSGNLTYDDLNREIINRQGPVYITWNTTSTKIPDAGNLTQFDRIFKPTKWEITEEAKNRRSKTYDIKETDYVLEGGVKKENEKYSAELLEYNRKKAAFLADSEYWNKHKSDGKLICYTDTQTTYQDVFDKDRVPFNYFFVDSNGVAPGAIGTNKGGIYGNNAKPCQDNAKAPIEYCSVYSYKDGAGTTFTDEQYKGGTALVPKIQGGKMDGTEIENTSIYVELTFRVKTFPTMIGKGLLTTENDQEVTVARLVDIELNNTSKSDDGDRTLTK